MEIMRNVREDIKVWKEQYRHLSTLKLILYLMFTQELYAVIIFRFGHWANYSCKLAVVSPIMKFFYFFMRKFSEIFFGIGIWPESEIGPGLKIEHWGGVYVKGKIGTRCRISQQVVIGHVGGFKGGGVPHIGDFVYIGAGAKVLGDISIGNNSIIGANAVVVHDIPSDSIAVGIPARVARKLK